MIYGYLAAGFILAEYASIRLHCTSCQPLNKTFGYWDKTLVAVIVLWTWPLWSLVVCLTATGRQGWTHVHPDEER